MWQVYDLPCCISLTPLILVLVSLLVIHHTSHQMVPGPVQASCDCTCTWLRITMYKIAILQPSSTCCTCSCNCTSSTFAVNSSCMNTLSIIIYKIIPVIKNNLRSTFAIKSVMEAMNPCMCLPSIIDTKEDKW